MHGPTNPREIIPSDYILPLGLAVNAAVKGLGVSSQSVTVGPAFPLRWRSGWRRQMEFGWRMAADSVAIQSLISAGNVRSICVSNGYRSAHDHVKFL